MTLISTPAKADVVWPDKNVPYGPSYQVTGTFVKTNNGTLLRIETGFHQKGIFNYALGKEAQAYANHVRNCLKRPVLGAPGVSIKAELQRARRYDKDDGREIYAGRAVYINKIIFAGLGISKRCPYLLSHNPISNDIKKR